MVAVADEIVQPSPLTIQLLSIALVNTLLGSSALEMVWCLNLGLFWSPPHWYSLHRQAFSLLQTKQLGQVFLPPPVVR